MVCIKYIYTDGSSLCCTLWPKVVRYTKKGLGRNYRKKIITFTDKYHYFVLTPDKYHYFCIDPWVCSRCWGCTLIQLYIIMPLKHLCPEMHAMAILAKNHQMAGENLNEVTRSAPYKVEKVIKMVNLSLQLFQERLIVAKTVHAIIPNCNMGYDQYTCSWQFSCWTYFCCFPLALANIRPWPLMPFFEIYLKNSELRTTHNTFPDCCVHFFRQPFSKQLYTCWLLKRADPNQMLKYNNIGSH